MGSSAPGYTPLNLTPIHRDAKRIAHIFLHSLDLLETLFQSRLRFRQPLYGLGTRYFMDFLQKIFV